MTVTKLSHAEGFEAVNLSEGDREITGVYIGDLLSWVMGKATSGDSWITIMSNINILAVASLTDCACVILAEGVTLEDDVKTAAQSKGINVISSQLSAYEIALRLNTMINNE